MKTLFLPLATFLVLACSLTSCVPLDDPYFAGGGGGYSEGYTTRRYTDYGTTSRRYYDNDYGTGYSGYGNRYYDNRPHSYYSSGYGYSSSVHVCNICHHNPCTCNHHHSSGSNYSHRRDDDDDHRSSSQNKYRYSGSVGRGDTKPVGNHSREWYKEHGYSLKNLRPSN